MKIILSNPPWEVDGRYGCRAGSRWPFLAGPPVYVPLPFFLAYATSYLLSKGIEAKYYDAIALYHHLPQYYQTIRDEKADIVIIETSTPSINEDLKIAEEVSKYSEVCLTGPHATVFADSLITLPYISYILKGEYEQSSYEMCTTRRKGIYEVNPIRDEDFDALPFPYRDEQYAYKYQDAILGSQYPQLAMMESRGCSFKCRFCVWPPVMYERKYRTFSNKRILDEIEDSVTKYSSYKDILFDSDTFGICRSEKIIDLSKGIKEFQIPWSIMSRADLHPLEVWLELFHNGCYGFRFGIENFSSRLSKLVGKREKFENVIANIKGLRQAGARVHLTTMKGFPTETEEDRILHQSMIREMQSIGASIQTSWMVPFPGTPYYDELKSQGMDFIDDWSCYSGESDNVKASQMVLKIVQNYKEKESLE